jgi:hypothetical protein
VSDTTTTTTTNRPLLPKHLDDLRRSGIDLATARAAGLFSATDPAEINQLLGRGDLGTRLGPCLILSYYAADGQPMTYRQADGKEAPFVRMKPDMPRPGRGDRPIKYEQPLNSTNRLFVPRGTDPAMLKNVGQDLIITEGEKKAIKLHQEDFLAVAVGGIWSWTVSSPDDTDAPQPGQLRELIEDLRLLPVAGRRINLVFDSDTNTDTRKYQPVEELARALQGRGARVYVVALPHLPGQGRTGADDYLVNVGVDGLNALINQTQPLRRRQQPHAGGGAAYVIEGGALHHQRYTANGVVSVPLCNFSANVTGEMTYDDGVEKTVFFELEGSLAAGGALPRVRVSANEFHSMTWVAGCWGARPIVNAGLGTKEHVRAAIQGIRTDYPRAVTFTHTGWREVDHRWVYLHNGGAVDADGAVAGVDVELPTQLGRFELPEPPTGEEQREAAAASLRILDLAPDTITFPLYAAMVRSVLGGADFSGFVLGPTGVFKTELGALIMQHWGAGLDARHVPAGWSSTGNALEGLAFAAKDCILLVDDFAPHGSEADVQRQHREADRLLRAQGNLSGRGRMRADGFLRPTKAPRGLILATGEDLPRGQSLRARLLVVEVGHGDVNQHKLSMCQADAAQGRYAAMMAGFTRWLAPQYNDVRLRMKQALAKSRAGKGGGQSDGSGESDGSKEEEDGGDVRHTRTPAMLVDLCFAFGVFLDFARSVGVATDEQRDQLLARGRAALEEVCRAQAKHIGAAEPASEFLRLVAAALTSRRAHLVNKDGGAPADPAVWGWDTTGAEPRSGGRLIGWLVGEDVYLDPASAYACAQEMSRAQGCSVPVTERVLWTRLRGRGKLASWDVKRQRNTMRKALGGIKEREVLHLTAAILFPSPSSSLKKPSDPSDCQDGKTQAQDLKQLSSTPESDGQPKTPSDGPSDSSPDRPIGPGPIPPPQQPIGRSHPQSDGLSDGVSGGPSDGSDSATVSGKGTCVANAAESDGSDGRSKGIRTPVGAVDAVSHTTAEVEGAVEVEIVGDEAGI